MSVLRELNPRRSFGAGVIWLIVALAAVFSIAATLWVGSIARESVIAQHMRRLSLEADQLSSAVTQAMTERLSAIRVTETLLRRAAGPHREDALREVFLELRTVYPQFNWIAVADVDRAVVGGVADLGSGEAGGSQEWLGRGLQAPWIGLIAPHARPLAALGGDKSSLGAMAAPVHDATGRVIGVVCAALSWRRTGDHPERLTDEVDGFGNAKAYLLDTQGIVLVGPPDSLGRRWPGARAGFDAARSVDATTAAHWEQLPDGAAVLVARGSVSLAPEYPGTHWTVQLSEPRDRAYRRANSLALRILGASSLLAAATAALGVVGARQLTQRLGRLADSVAAAGAHDSGHLAVPPGRDEVAQLGAAFAHLLAELHRERRELERRVAVRTREVERLAEDARYAAVVRERLKIGRDLHDTLAHSMMAILSEIRYLRRLQAREPQSVANELERAEAIAHEGLKEARSAITQMRVSTVRETGLGEALAREVERLVTRTGIAAETSIDPEAARLADDRAETLCQMAQEVLRNIERHSLATEMTLTLQRDRGVSLALRIKDNGTGFDASGEYPGHYGLVGLREQADLIGATLHIDSGPDRGTQFKIELPLSPVAFA